MKKSPFPPQAPHVNFDLSLTSIAEQGKLREEPSLKGIKSFTSKLNEILSIDNKINMPKRETFLRILGTDRRNRNVLTDKLLRQAI